MSNPARFAIERPRVVALATLLVLLYGVLSYQGLARQENPTLPERFATVLTYLPGAEPEKVELLVTRVLEDRIAEVDDIDEIFTRTGPATSFVLVQLKKTAVVAQRLEQIRDKVQEARAALPAGASEPEVNTRVFRTYTLLLTVTGSGVPPLALREQAETLEREIEALPDVRRVELLGEPREEIAVGVDLRRLSQRGMTLDHLVGVLEARNTRLPSGELDVGALKSAIQTTGAWGAADEVAATYLGAGPDGLPVRLSDVASVQRGLAEPEVLVRSNGLPAVALAVEMLPDRNAIAFGERVRSLLARWQADMPEGLDFTVVADEPRVVDDRLGLLTRSLLFGMVLVVGMALLGMGWRSGAIVSLSIPLSLTAAMGLLGALQVPLHQISIAALVIALGLVVDEAIVVTDNIQRHLDRGVPVEQAAVDGLGEIHLAVLAGAATTLAAFIPLLLMVGDVGEFTRSIPLVVSLTLVASVAVAHFVTPLLAVAAHRWLGRGTPRRHSGASSPGRAYQAWLARVVERPRTVLGLFVLALLASAGVVRTALWPLEFFPDADRRQFLIKLTLPSGARVEDASETVRSVEAHLADDPDVAEWSAFVGADAPKFYYNEFDNGRAENRATLVVNLRDDLPFRRVRPAAERIDAQLRAHVVGARIRTRVLRQGYGGSEDIEIYLTGEELPVLRVLADRVREIVEGIEGTDGVRDSFGYDPVTLQARVDAGRANLFGITHRDVATTLRTALDGVTATRFQEGDDEIDVVVRLAATQRRSATELEVLPIHSPTAGRALPLAQVARLEAGWTTREILRYQREREAMVEADLRAGASILEVTGAIERAVRERVALPPGYRIHFFGQRRDVTESFLSLAKAAVVAVFLIYIILVVRFRSLAQPLLILLAIPMAGIGSTLGLAATGSPLGFMAFLGIISLIGIAVNDSIVLVDYINTLRGRGVALDDAVLKGAATRLRAVALTSLTTMGGLLPLSLTGGDFWAPFGFAMIFGLGASTLLTLGVQPTAYLALERWHARRAGAAMPAPR